MRIAAISVTLSLLIVSMFTFAINIDLASAGPSLELEMILSKDVFTIGEEINVTLTLTNTGDENIKITFGPPFFDLFYCTSEGCFRWSDDKVFVLVILDLVLEPGENYTETLQWNLYQYEYPDYYPPQPGTYTLNCVSYWVGLAVSAIVRVFYPVLHTVPDDYQTIQEAINAASDGETIFVRAGTYYEHVIVNKSVLLIGEDRGTTIIDGIQIGTVIKIPVDNVTLWGFTVQHSGTEYPPNYSGIHLDSSSGCDISHNIVRDNYYGINLENSSNNKISYNTISHQIWHGIRLINSHSNTISENNSSYNWNEGIYALESYNNSIVTNILTDNNNGIYLLDSGNTKIIKNTLTHNLLTQYSTGISLYSNNCTLIENLISDNSYGIAIPTSDNVIYHNSFIQNTHHINLINEYENAWDNSFEGNYWSDYNGTDLDENGIGDTPYVIGENNQDNYPLMNPYLGHNVAIDSLTISKNVVGQGYTSLIYLNVSNLGSFPETFYLTVYANATALMAESITISYTNSTTRIVIWNTTGFLKGKYRITVNATSVPHETKTVDNFVERWVLITILGDIDGDRHVKGKDALLLGSSFGYLPESIKWNGNADLNNDGWINAKDVIILGLHFNESWT